MKGFIPARCAFWRQVLLGFVEHYEDLDPKYKAIVPLKRVYLPHLVVSDDPNEAESWLLTDAGRDLVPGESLMKRAVLYAVSTVDQHPESQLHDIRELAHQRGYAIVSEYTDKISGTKAKRPGLDELMSGARRGRV